MATTTKRLTTKAVENARRRPGPHRYELADAGSGLYLCVQPSGAKSWACRFRFEGRPIKMSLGSWPAMTLASARKAAAEAVHEVAQGRNPAAARFAANAAAAASAADTVE